MNPEESQWIQQARDGSTEAFGRLVLLHQSHVRAYLGSFIRNAEVADDLAQDVFLNAYRSLKTYQGDAPLRIWLFGFARNLALNHLRRDARRLARESGRLAQDLARFRVDELESAAAEPVARESELTALRECIEGLPKESARVVKAFYFESRSAVEIAEALGRTANTIRLLLFRVRKGLRQCVEARTASAGS